MSRSFLSTALCAGVAGYWELATLLMAGAFVCLAGWLLFGPGGRWL